MHVSALNVYPVKSMEGATLLRSEVTKRGLVGDRLWMVVDANGDFQTQRDFPKMATITVEIPDDGSLFLSGKRASLICVEKPDPETALAHEVTVWDDTCQALDAGDDAAAWINAYLGTKGFRLVRIKDDFVRPVVDPYAGPGGQAAFADAYSILLTSESSLAALRAFRASDDFNASVAMTSFRPNIVIADAPPFAEDLWDVIEIGGQPFRIGTPYERCNVTTIDQDTGEKNPGSEPLRSLKKLRAGKSAEGGARVYFGVSAMPVQAGAVINVGDQVSVRVTRDPAPEIADARLTYRAAHRPEPAF